MARINTENADMTVPRKPERILTDDELGVVSSGLLPVVTNASEDWTDETRKLAKPVPMPKVILKQATARPTVAGDSKTTVG